MIFFSTYAFLLCLNAFYAVMLGIFTNFAA